jgi:CheY-like chemotaxis protein
MTESTESERQPSRPLMRRPSVADCTVLIVDDSTEDISLLKAAFEQLDETPHLRCHTSAVDAMKWLEGLPAGAERGHRPGPDLILLDIQMPIHDGLEVLRWLRAQPHDWSSVPVIMLTTSHDYLEIRKAYSIGANSFLVKPTGFGELLAMVQELVTYWLVRNRGS